MEPARPLGQGTDGQTADRSDAAGRRVPGGPLARGHLPRGVRESSAQPPHRQKQPRQESELKDNICIGKAFAERLNPHPAAAGAPHTTWANSGAGMQRAGGCLAQGSLAEPWRASVKPAGASQHRPRLDTYSPGQGVLTEPTSEPHGTSPGWVAEGWGVRHQGLRASAPHPPAQSQQVGPMGSREPALGPSLIEGWGARHRTPLAASLFGLGDSPRGCCQGWRALWKEGAGPQEIWEILEAEATSDQPKGPCQLGCGGQGSVRMQEGPSGWAASGKEGVGRGLSPQRGKVREARLWCCSPASSSHAPGAAKRPQQPLGRAFPAHRRSHGARLGS